MLIDRSSWNDVEFGKKGKIQIPTLQTPELNAFNLRGRRIDKASGIAFDGILSGFFSILKCNGSLIGGRRLRNKP